MKKIERIMFATKKFLVNDVVQVILGALAAIVGLFIFAALRHV